MPIPTKDLRLLYQRSGNRCAFDGCGDLLTADAAGPDGPAVLGHVAHIVGQSRLGPRGEEELPEPERDQYDNLVLLCAKHHKVVDSQSATYTSSRLHAMKQQHEERVEALLDGRLDGSTGEREWASEVLHSNLMVVQQLPQFVYSAPCRLSESQVREVAQWPVSPLIAPFIVRGASLYAFQDPRADDFPFAQAVEHSQTRQHRLCEWWEDVDKTNWFLTLANKSLYSHARRRGLQHDREHRRYYFAPLELGEERSVTYRPLSRRSSRRRVVYQPRSKRYGTALSFWVHLAVRLRLLQCSPGQFVISIHPDLHVTRDGAVPLPPWAIGEKVTRRKSRWFNFETLGHVQFWRHYLSEGRPRIMLQYSRSSAIVIPTTLLQTSVQWPGIPVEHAKSFTQVVYQEDLFSALEQMPIHEDDEGDMWSE